MPTGIALFISQLGLDQSRHPATALVSAVGGVVAMVPEGLILLTSVAFAVGVVRLARQRTLVQELPAIEVLARVDVICLDKTGTITAGAMDVADVDVLGDGRRRRRSSEALAAIAWSDPHPNATQAALQRRFADRAGLDDDGLRRRSRRPASGARRSFDGHGTWVFGAPEIVLDGESLRVDRGRGHRGCRQRQAGPAARGERRRGADERGETLPDDLDAVALVMLEDEIRPDAAETLGVLRRRRA